VDSAGPGRRGDSELLQRFIIDEVSRAEPDGLEVNTKIEGLPLRSGERIDFSITGRLAPDRSAYIAVETFTENGSTVSEVTQLTSDSDGRIYQY
jgi:hypothetical protein